MTVAPPNAPSDPALTAALLDCAAVFLPGDPPRTARIAFWRPDGTEPVAHLPGTGDDTESADAMARLTVALPAGGATPTGEGDIRLARVPAYLLPVAAALPVLTRARAAAGGSGASYWGAAALLALQLAARGRLLPGLSATEHDSWRLGPLSAEDAARLSDLADAMPPEAHAVPLGTGPDGADTPPEGPVRLPEPAGVLRAFLNAVADGLPRTPAATAATGSPVLTGVPPRRAPELRPWAEAVADAHDRGVRLSLRVETDAAGDERPSVFRAVLQVHDLGDTGLMTDAARLWHDPAGCGAFGPRAREDTLLALRRAADAWSPLRPLLSTSVPDAVELDDSEIGELLGVPVSQALRAAGVTVHWPRELVRELHVRAEVGPGDRPEGGPPSLLSPDALLAFRWRHALGDEELSRAELHRLAEANRPVVRLRDRWVLVDPEAVRRALDRQDRSVAPATALHAALTGQAEDHGTEVEVRATGWLDRLRRQLSDPDAAAGPPVEPPAALRATLRGYQRDGLDWLHRMTSHGLGCVLADDMGLGKTLTLLALHLHRNAPTPERPDTAVPDATAGAGNATDPAGPTLVVCPTSLLGTWEREAARFAPDTPVRRFHGPGRSLSDPEPAVGELVLTTYGTLRRDTERLTQVAWGLVVADEAQHVKNPHSATARALRSVPAGARVALTGTPVENSLTDLWALLDWATPGLLGPLGTFRRRYADAAERGTDPEATARLARLTGPFLLRRRKTDPGIAPELPPRTETDRVVPLTPEQAGLYEAVVREGLEAVAGRDGLARRGLVVRLLTSLKQICNHPAHYLGEEDPRLGGRSGKLEAFDELLGSVLAADAATLVFTQYVRMARLLRGHLAARGVPALLLHGGTPVRQREELVRAFQSGAAPVFLLSLKAAGTGLTLTRAEHVIHFDRWWNPAVEAQATDRAHRIGQDRPVQVHRLVTEGTVEDRIAALLRRKQAMADAVLGGGEAALANLTDRELAELVELRGGDR